MSGRTKVCMVLRPSATRKDFERAAEDLGFEKRHEYPGDGQRDAYEQVWATPDQTSAANYVESPLVSLSYISLRGALLRYHESEFAHRVPVFAEEETLELALEAEGLEETAEALHRVAVTFVGHHKGVVRLFTMFAAQAPDPRIRFAALNSIVYRAWPQFIPVLETIRDEDPHPRVRERAEEVLAVVHRFQHG